MARAPQPQVCHAFVRQIDKHKPAPVYLVVGDEPFFRQRVIAALRQRILGPEAPAENVQQLTGKRKGGDPASDVSEVLAVLRTPSLFDPVRMVHVEEAEALLSKEAGVAITAYLEKPAKGAHLVLECKSVDGRTKAGKALKHKAVVVECAKLYDRPAPWETDAAPWEYQLAAWLVAEARRAGLKMNQPAAHALVQRTGSEPGLLSAECGRLAAIVGAEAEVTGKHVESLVEDTRGESLFRIGDAVAARDAKEALKVLDSLFREGMPEKSGGKTRDINAIAIRAVGWVHRTLRELWVARSLMDQGKGADAVARALGKKPVFAEVLCRNARRFKADEFLALWPRLLKADVGLKTGSPARITVEALLIEVCA